MQNITVFVSIECYVCGMYLSLPFSLFKLLVDALYRSTYPEYLQYIYLVAPVSLMLLNPIGFALCEVQKLKLRQSSYSQHRTLGIVAVVILQVLCLYECKEQIVASYTHLYTSRGCNNLDKTLERY